MTLNPDPLGGMNLPTMIITRIKVIKLLVASNYCTRYRTSLIVEKLLLATTTRTQITRHLKIPFLLMRKVSPLTQKNAHVKVNYTYAINDKIIHIVEPVNNEYCNITTIKGKEDTQK